MRMKHFFFSNKKNYQLHIKGYFVTKNCFVVEVTFKIEETFQANLF